MITLAINISYGFDKLRGLDKARWGEVVRTMRPNRRRQLIMVMPPFRVSMPSPFTSVFRLLISAIVSP